MTTDTNHHVDAAPEPQPYGMREARRPTGPILGIVMSIVLMMLGQLPTLAVASGDGPMPWTTQAAMTYSFLGSAVLLWLWLRFKERRSFASLGFRQASARQALLGLVLGVVFTAIVVGINVVTGQAHLGAATLTGVLPLLVVLGGFIVQGGTEEIFDRGFVMQAVAWKWGILAGLVIQTVCFAVLHAANGGLTVFAYANLAGVAIFLGLWTLATNSLVGPCLFHGLWNWSQGNLWGAHVSNQVVADSIWHYRADAGSPTWLSGGGFGLEGSAIATVLFALGSLVMFVVWRRRVNRADVEARPAG